MKEEEEKQNKFGSSKKPDVITIEEEQINILLSDDINLLQYIINEVKEENKKYDADDEKPEAIATAPELVLNETIKKDDDTDTEDEKEVDDPLILDVFINGNKAEIQIY